MKFAHDRAIVRKRVGAREPDYSDDYIVKAHKLPNRVFLPYHSLDPADYFARPPALRNDLLKDLAELLAVYCVSRQEAERSGGIGHHCTEWLIQFVCE